MNETLFSPAFASSPTLEALQRAELERPFSDDRMAFISVFSERLLASPAARRFPELTALAFWMRPASMNKLKGNTLSDGRIFAARGTAFHIAPGNVDTLFVYSWFLSLVCGNRNIVRLSRRPSPQTDVLLDIMSSLFSEPRFAPVAASSLVVRYEHDQAVTNKFSIACDVRVIWGGNDTVARIRQSPLAPTACEMTFANKYSLAVLDAEAIDAAAADQLDKWASALCNDAYWFGQMACSSPRLILWLGQPAQVTSAQQRFWPAVERRLAQMNAVLDTADYVNKRVAADTLAMTAHATVPKTANNDLTRVWIDTLALHDNEHCGGGLFFEARIASLDALEPLLSRQIQTLVYAGVSREALASWLMSRAHQGIDRIVPLGRALDFQPVWDGYDLPRMFMREVVLV